MKQSIVVSVLGEDSPGLVESLSKLIVEHQGEWVESRMASLSGKFAGILRVDLPADEVPNFTQALSSESLGLKVIYEETAEPSVGGRAPKYQIELVGQDRPGIVHKLTHALAQLGANVEELESEVIEASMSGEQLFKANLTVKLPLDVDRNAVRESLEQIANELIVDIDLAESDD